MLLEENGKEIYPKFQLGDECLKWTLYYSLLKTAWSWTYQNFKPLLWTRYCCKNAKTSTEWESCLAKNLRQEYTKICYELTVNVIMDRIIPIPQTHLPHYSFTLWVYVQMELRLKTELWTGWIPVCPQCNHEDWCYRRGRQMDAALGPCSLCGAGFKTDGEECESRITIVFRRKKRQENRLTLELPFRSFFFTCLIN